MFHKLINVIGYAWTMRAIALVVLCLSIVPALSMKKRGRSTSSRRGLDFAAFKDSEYTLFAIAMFLGYLGLYIPFFYIQLYSLEKSNITGELDFYLLPIMNASGFFGRLVSSLHSILDFPHTVTDCWPHGRYYRAIQRFHFVRECVRSACIWLGRDVQRSKHPAVLRVVWSLQLWAYYNTRNRSRSEPLS